MRYDILVIGAIFTFVSTSSLAIDPHQCDSSVAKCVGEVVDLANKLMVENQQLEKRIAELGTDLADTKTDYEKKLKLLSDGFDQKIAALRSELTQNENQIKSNVKSWTPGDNFSNGQQQCPPGYYMIGLTADASSGQGCSVLDTLTTGSRFP